jgi:hypothetical protein
VNDIPELRQIRINAEHAVTNVGAQLTYGKYLTLLLSATNSFDKTHHSTRSHQKKQHSNTMNLNDDTDFDGEYYEEAFAPDTDDFHVDTLLANVTQRRPPVQTQKQRVHRASAQGSSRNFIPKEAWDRIPKDVQELLISINRKGYSNANQPSRKVELTEQFDIHDHVGCIDTLPTVTNDDSMLAFIASRGSQTPDYGLKILATNTGISKSDASPLSITPK